MGEVGEIYKKSGRDVVHSLAGVLGHGQRTCIFDRGHRTGCCRLTTKEFLEECSHAVGPLPKILAIREVSSDAGGGLEDQVTQIILYTWIASLIVEDV